MTLRRSPRLAAKIQTVTLRRSARLAAKVAAPQPQPQQKPREKVIIPEPPADTSEEAAQQYILTLLKIRANMNTCEVDIEVTDKLCNFLQSRAYSLPHSVVFKWDTKPLWIWSRRITETSEVEMWRLDETKEIKAVCKIRTSTRA